MRDKIKFNIFKRNKLKEENYYPHNIVIGFTENGEKKKFIIPYEDLHKYIVKIEKEEQND